MKMYESPYFEKNLEVEGYVKPEEWQQIADYFNRSIIRFNTLDLSRVTNISIPKNTFAESANLREVTLPEGLVTIEAGAFENCISLKRVSFSKFVKNIEENAFKNCSLKEFYAPKSLEYLGDKAFYNNNSNFQLKLNETIQFTGKEASAYEEGVVKVVRTKEKTAKFYEYEV